MVMRITIRIIIICPNVIIQYLTIAKDYVVMLSYCVPNTQNFTFDPFCHISSIDNDHK